MANIYNAIKVTCRIRLYAVIASNELDHLLRDVHERDDTVCSDAMCYMCCQYSSSFTCIVYLHRGCTYRLYTVQRLCTRGIIITTLAILSIEYDHGLPNFNCFLSSVIFTRHEYIKTTLIARNEYGYYSLSLTHASRAASMNVLIL